MKNTSGILSGYGELDDLTGGFKPSEFTVIAARPDVGKTSFSLSMVANISIKNKLPVGLFSLEISSQRLIQWIVAGEAMLDINKIKTGLLKPTDFHNLTEATSRIHDAPIYIEDTPNLSLLDLRNLAKSMKSKNNVAIIFIDNLALITPENQDIPQYEQITEICYSLKSLAWELNIPVVATSRLQKCTEGKRPNLMDIRESGLTEANVDILIFLHREQHVDKDMEEGLSVIETEISVAKLRNGPIGMVKLAFIPKYMTFQRRYTKSLT